MVFPPFLVHPVGAGKLSKEWVLSRKMTTIWLPSECVCKEDLRIRKIVAHTLCITTRRCTCVFAKETSAMVPTGFTEDENG